MVESWNDYNRHSQVEPTGKYDYRFVEMTRNKAVIWKGECARMITDLGLDLQGRIWARRGTQLNPVFEVFSNDGEHIFTAEIPGIGDAGQFWNFSIDEQGMAAYSSNPELYQQIYLLELEE